MSGFDENRKRREVWTRFPRRLHWIAFLAVVVAPPLALNAFAILQPWTDPKFLYRDPLLLAQNQFEWLRSNPANTAIGCCYYWWGAISNVGVLVWSVTAGALLLTICVQALRGAATGFFALAFLLTALFAADDLFQFHEQPNLFGPLKGEAVIYPVYFLLFAGYAFFRDTVLTRCFPVLCLAVICFAVSLLADQLLPQRGVTVVIEDSTKLLGIFFWMAFHMMVSVEALLGRETFFVAAPAPSSRG